MAATAHLDDLNKKHRVLEQKIAEEISRPAADGSKITRLKAEKLKLKDRITRLAASIRH